jgi:hypothetical protein
MTRTSIKTEPKPAKGPRPKKCANRACREPYVPDARQPFKVWCSDDCGTAIALDRLAKQKAAKEKAVRAADRKQLHEVRERAKRKADYIADAQKAFNAWVRERDADKPCICCGKYFDAKDLATGGQWDAGHYLSRGHAPHLRFDERNVHRQLKGHNRPGGTTRASFRRGMEERIGIEALLALEADVTPRHFSIQDLIAIRDEYRARLKELKASRKLSA